jgi:hypothetical protein
MGIKRIFVIIFILTSFYSKGQTRADSIKSLVRVSNQYLNILFNKEDAYLATKFWSNDCFEQLKVGYNNGGIAYANNSDLVKLFSTDLKKFLKPLNKPIKFYQVDNILFFTGDEGYKYFSVNFNLGKKLNVDSSLNSTSLDFVSKDNGLTWKLNTDHWLGRYMYFLYRKNKR